MKCVLMSTELECAQPSMDLCPEVGSTLSHGWRSELSHSMPLYAPKSAGTGRGSRMRKSRMRRRTGRGGAGMGREGEREDERGGGDNFFLRTAVEQNLLRLVGLLRQVAPNAQRLLIGLRRWTCPADSGSLPGGLVFCRSSVQARKDLFLAF